MKSRKSTELGKLVLKTIEVYNRYRSPEAKARLLKLESDGFIIKFQGSFCQSCGVQDYIEDFIYEFESLTSNAEAQLGEIKQVSPLSFEVQITVKGSFSSDKTGEEALFQEFLQERGLTVRDYSASNPCTRDIARFHFRTWLQGKKSKRSTFSKARAKGYFKPETENTLPDD